MAVVNICLKYLFIGLNILYIILAGAVFALALKLNSYIQNTEALAWLQVPIWFLGFGILVVACLGIYGARKEKKWPLISFITANVIGLTITLLHGSMYARAKILLSRAKTDYSGMFDTQLAVSFGLTALELIGITMAAIFLHQLRSRQPDKY